MKLSKEDIIKFYELLSRYDLTSPNIAVVGDKRKFNRQMKEVYKKFKNKPNCKIIINENKTKYIILLGDIEITYIHIQQFSDMIGLKFRKFI